MPKTERKKMLAGELYNPLDTELMQNRRRARLLCKKLNDSNDEEEELRKQILKELFNDQADSLWIEPPFHCDYGTNIKLGKKVFFNFNCVVLDVAEVTIGDEVMFAPNVQIYTATHPLDWKERASGLELAKPITVGSNVWIGGGVIICPGVIIGNRTVIGAGSVVTKDIPADVVAAGNPCKVIRSLI
jgi:maltose O-acetyltransferase